MLQRTPFTFRRYTFPTFWALFLLVASSCAQQLGTAVVSGELADPQSAMVSGAQIVAVQTATGLQRATTSNSSGLFAINDMAPGDYELRVSAAGFATYVAPVHLEVGQQAAVKIRLGLPSQQTTVDVGDVEITEEVNTTSSVIDGVVNSPQIDTGAELNAFLTPLNAQGATDGGLPIQFPMVFLAARFDDTFNSFDLRLSKQSHLSERFSCEVVGGTFNLFNKTNILGTSKNNYSGFFNALVPDSTDPTNPASHQSSAFRHPVSTAGGVFGSGGPRAFQLAAKLTF